MILSLTRSLRAKATTSGGKDDQQFFEPLTQNNYTTNALSTKNDRPGRVKQEEIALEIIGVKSNLPSK